LCKNDKEADASPHWQKFEFGGIFDWLRPGIALGNVNAMLSCSFAQKSHCWSRDGGQKAEAQCTPTQLLAVEEVSLEVLSSLELFCGYTKLQV